MAYECGIETLEDLVTSSGFRLIFRQSGDPMALLDPVTGRILDANPALREALGEREIDPLIGRLGDSFSRSSATASPTDGPFAIALRSLETEGSVRFEWEASTVSGAPVCFDVVISRLAQGPQSWTLATLRDISLQKQQEAALVLSEARWRGVFEQIPMSMQLFAPDGTTRRINRAFEDLFHLTLDDLQGFNILQDQQLEDAGFRQSVAQAFAGEVKTIPPIPFELRTRPDQVPRGLRWIGSTMFPVFDPQGRIVEVVCVHEDITTSKQSEDEIHRLNLSLEQRIAERTAELTVSEERFKQLFEFSPLGIARVDEAGQFHQANAAFCELVGYSEDELLTMAYWDLTPPDYHRDQAASIAHLHASGKFGPFEKEYLHRDGHRIPVMLNGVRVRSSDGQIQIWGLAENITLRREAERALRESEEKFKALFELSPLGMARVSWTGEFLEVNESFSRIIGYQPQEILQLSRRDVSPGKDEAVDRHILDTVTRTGRFGPIEKEYIHRDGHLVPVVLNGMQIRGRNGQTELWEIAQDITSNKLAEEALRGSERKFRALFEASGQGVMIHDENERFAQVNPAAARLFGLEPADMIGRHPGELAPDFQPDGTPSKVSASRHIADCYRLGKTRFDWVHLHSDGHEVLLEVILTHFKDGERNLLQAVVTDISEQRRAEEEMKRSLERERELNQLKSNFVSMVSHEFRTPLGIIQSSAEILHEYLDHLDPQERADQLRSILKNSKRMAGLMEDVLLLGRLDAGRLEFLPRPLDLADLCRRLVEEVHSTTDARCPIHFFTENLPSEVNADERLLQHILLNLLNNAVKYSEHGQSVIFQAIGDGDTIRFVVEDRGIGIPEGEEELLFEAFHRGSNVGQRPGTGLGLVIVRQSIDLHGGDYQLLSKPGIGTTFRISIPTTPPSTS
jgi:PAS domain S-box-containing protein